MGFWRRRLTGWGGALSFSVALFYLLSPAKAGAQEVPFGERGSAFVFGFTLQPAGFASSLEARPFDYEPVWESEPWAPLRFGGKFELPSARGPVYEGFRIDGNLGPMAGPQRWPDQGLGRTGPLDPNPPHRFSPSPANAIFFAFSPSLPNAASQSDRNPALSQPGMPSPVSDFRPRLSPGPFLRTIWSHQRAIWTSPLRGKNRKLRLILPVALATGALFAFDNEVGNGLSLHPPGSGYDASAAVSHIGSTVVVYGYASAFYGISRMAGREYGRQTGVMALEALVNSSILVEMLKLGTGRQRPTSHQGEIQINESRGEFGKAGHSFPSGHSMHAFALASVFAARYPDKPIVKYGAYGLASAIAASRITARRHFPSDVLVGSVLGYLIGHYVVRKHFR